MNIFEKMLQPKDESKEEGKPDCPVCHAPLQPVGPQKEGSSFNNYQCANGHQVLQ